MVLDNPTLDEMIQAAALKYDSADDAVNALMRKIKKDPDDVMRLALIGLRYRLHCVRSDNRSKPMRATNANTTTTKPRSGADLAAAASAAYGQSIFDLYRVNDKRLGDCTTEDLRVCIDDHRRHADGLQRRIGFLGKIEGSMGRTKKTVRNACKESQVTSWHEEMLAEV